MTIYARAFAALLIALTLPAEAGTMHYECKICSSATFVTDPAEREIATASLQTSFITRVGDGHITRCLIVREIFGKGFTGLGGTCNVTFAHKTTRWMVCNDDGIGKFAASTGPGWFEHPELSLAQFTDDNCVGG